MKYGKRVGAAMLLLGVGATIVGAAREPATTPAEEVLFVAVDRAPVGAAAQSEGNTLFGEVLRGTALRVHQRAAGFALVTLEGWVPEAMLAKEPPLPEEPGDAPAPVVKPALPLEPVHDLAAAHQIRVGVTFAEGKDVMSIALEMQTTQGRPVIVDGDKREGRIIIFEQRKIAGGRARGDILFEKAVTLEAGRAKIEIALRELLRRPAFVLVSSSAPLPGDHSLHGAATDVALPAK